MTNEREDLKQSTISSIKSIRKSNKRCLYSFFFQMFFLMIQILLTVIINVNPLFILNNCIWIMLTLFFYNKSCESLSKVEELYINCYGSLPDNE